MQNEIIKKLINISDPKYKQFSTVLCPGSKNILGVKIPLIRTIAKEIYKENKWKSYLKLKPKYFEEIMIQAMLIGFIKDDIAKVINLVKNFIPKIDNWAVCDIFCSGLKITKKHRTTLWKFIQNYSNSKKEFELRFMTVMMLCYFLDDEYIHKVLERCNTIKNDGYYVKMAVAWTVATAYAKYPEITLNYLKKCNLDVFTFNKSLQKIRESYRVSQKDKEIIKRMKKC